MQVGYNYSMNFHIVLTLFEFNINVVQLEMHFVRMTSMLVNHFAIVDKRHYENPNGTFSMESKSNF